MPQSPLRQEVARLLEEPGEEEDRQEEGPRAQEEGGAQAPEEHVGQPHDFDVLFDRHVEIRARELVTERERADARSLPRALVALLFTLMVWAVAGLLDKELGDGALGLADLFLATLLAFVGVCLLVAYYPLASALVRWLSLRTGF